MHKGVGLIITNKKRTLFFVQQKDENYPVEKWAKCYSFWGGKIEESDFSYLEALKRELYEEINGNIDFTSSKIEFVSKFIVNCDKTYEFNLFELVVDDMELQELKSTEIFEGHGVLISLNELINGKWIWCLERVINQYVKTGF